MDSRVGNYQKKFMKREVPDFRAGDTVRVLVRIVEGNRERLQRFEGVCIARHGGGMDQTFTVRRVSFGIGMERIFALHSPRVETIQVLRHGQVRRAKLYYLRELSGKRARIPDTRRKRPAKDAMIQLIATDTPEDPGEELVAEAAEAPPESSQAELPESAAPEAAQAEPAGETAKAGKPEPGQASVQESPTKPQSAPSESKKAKDEG